jgi:hypothetical protein
MSRRAILIIVVLSVVGVAGWLRFGDALVQGMEEEHSYSRHAMEYHRAHPNHRRGDTVLETWSSADLIAQSISKQTFQVPWVTTSDQLDFLDYTLRKDKFGRPFCVAQRKEDIVIIDFGDRPNPILSCDLESIVDLDLSSIRSGDMLYTDRSDWVYVLRTPASSDQLTQQVTPAQTAPAVPPAQESNATVPAADAPTPETPASSTSGQ